MEMVFAFLTNSLEERRIFLSLSYFLYLSCFNVLTILSKLKLLTLLLYLLFLYTNICLYMYLCVFVYVQGGQRRVEERDPRRTRCCSCDHSYFCCLLIRHWTQPIGKEHSLPCLACLRRRFLALICLLIRKHIH